MEGQDNKPRVFVSSTISDLQDIRGAVKYWLEELGYRVEMSEFRDFGRRPNQDAFESCFALIPQCNYFVLMVGGRRGSWYIENDVSVTQEEYRIATRLAKEGRIRIVILARSDVIDRIRALRSSGRPIGRKGIRLPSGLTIQDPQFLNTFLEEIKSTELKEKGEDPSGAMWIYRFTEFRDVAEVLRSNIQIKGSIARRVLLANLKWELIENIAAMCAKSGELPFPGYWYIEDTRKEIPLDASTALQRLGLTQQQSDQIILFLILGAPSESRLQSIELRNAISSGEFLYFEQSRERLEPSPVLRIMYRLREQIESFRIAYGWWKQENMERVVGELRAGVPWKNPSIMEIDLLYLFAFYDRLVNIMRLIMCLIDYIEDPLRELVVPSLLDTSPYGKKESEQVVAETATHEDIEDWLKYEMTRRQLSRLPPESVHAAEALEMYRRFPKLLDVFSRSNSMTKEEALKNLELLRDLGTIFQAEGEKGAMEFLKLRFPDPQIGS